MPEIVVTASPRQRWTLALILFAPELKPELAGRAGQRRLYRARRDLGLLEPSEAFLRYNPRLAPGEQITKGPGAEDHESRQAFRLTEEDVDFLLQVPEKVTIGPGDAIWVEPLFQQLEARTDSPDAGEAPFYDQAADVLRWRPLAEPP